MARAFHFLMAEGPAERPEAVFEAIDQSMTSIVHEVLNIGGGCRPGILGRTYQIALDRIGFPVAGA